MNALDADAMETMIEGIALTESEAICRAVIQLAWPWKIPEVVAGLHATDTVGSGGARPAGRLPPPTPIAWNELVAGGLAAMVRTTHAPRSLPIAVSTL